MMLEKKYSLQEKMIEGIEVSKSSSPQDAYRQCINFIQEMAQKNPGKEYVDRDFIKGLQPFRDNPAFGFVTYAATLQERTIGIVSGGCVGKKFAGIIILVDKEFRNTNAVRELGNAIFRDFKEITFFPEATEDKRGASDPTARMREQAIVRYSEKLGFQPDTADLDLSERMRYLLARLKGKDPDVDLPMTWKKKDRDERI